MIFENYLCIWNKQLFDTQFSLKNILKYPYFPVLYLVSEILHI